jgi:hypothetical protein
MPPITCFCDLNHTLFRFFSLLLRDTQLNHFRTRSITYRYLQRLGVGRDEGARADAQKCALPIAQNAISGAGNVPNLEDFNKGEGKTQALGRYAASGIPVRLYDISTTCTKAQ